MISIAVTDYQEYLGFFGYDFFQKIVDEFSKQLTDILRMFPQAELYRYYGMEFAVKVNHEDDSANTESMLSAIGELNEKYPGGAMAQIELLEAEGHTIFQRGRTNIRHYVKDYEYALYELDEG